VVYSELLEYYFTHNYVITIDAVAYTLTAEIAVIYVSSEMQW